MMQPGAVTPLHRVSTAKGLSTCPSRQGVMVNYLAFPAVGIKVVFGQACSKAWDIIYPSTRLSSDTEKSTLGIHVAHSTIYVHSFSFSLGSRLVCTARLDVTSVCVASWFLYRSCCSRSSGWVLEATCTSPLQLHHHVWCAAESRECSKWY